MPFGSCSQDIAFGEIHLPIAAATIGSGRSTRRRATIGGEDGFGASGDAAVHRRRVLCVARPLGADRQERLGEIAGNLRQEVECSPVSLLPRLAREALNLTDVICWFTLDHGDVCGFCRCAETAAALREFTACANL
jgi:hypothetical protein